MGKAEKVDAACNFLPTHNKILEDLEYTRAGEQEAIYLLISIGGASPFGAGISAFCAFPSIVPRGCITTVLASVAIPATVCRSPFTCNAAACTAANAMHLAPLADSLLVQREAASPLPLRHPWSHACSAAHCSSE